MTHFVSQFDDLSSKNLEFNLIEHKSQFKLIQN